MTKIIALILAALSITFASAAQQPKLGGYDHGYEEYGYDYYGYDYVVVEIVIYEAELLPLPQVDVPMRRSVDLPEFTAYLPLHFESDR